MAMVQRHRRFLQSLGFAQSHADSNVYVYGKGDRRMLLLLYVDGISLAYPSSMAAVVAGAEAGLAVEYEITGLGAVQWFPGIQISHGDGDGRGTSIALGQKAFISAVLRRFGVEEANGVATPMDTNVKLDLAEEHNEREVDPKGYQAIMGSLVYIALATRPDIGRQDGLRWRWRRRASGRRGGHGGGGMGPGPVCL